MEKIIKDLIKDSIKSESSQIHLYKKNIEFISCKNNTLLPMHDITHSIIGFAFAHYINTTNDKTFLNDKLQKYIDEIWDRRIRVKHILEMTSGMCSISNLSEMNDYVYYASQKDTINMPGSKFQYNTTASIMLPVVFKKITKKPIDEYLNTLFTPLGIRNRWSRDKSNNLYKFYTNSRGLVKIGQLIIQSGIIKLLSTKSVKNSNYSKFGWWIRGSNKHIYAADTTGQYLIIIPKKGIILSRLYNITKGVKEKNKFKTITKYIEKLDHE